MFCSLKQIAHSIHVQLAEHFPAQHALAEFDVHRWNFSQIVPNTRKIRATTASDFFVSNLTADYSLRSRKFNLCEVVLELMSILFPKDDHCVCLVSHPSFYSIWHKFTQLSGPYKLLEAIEKFCNTTHFLWVMELSSKWSVFECPNKLASWIIDFHKTWHNVYAGICKLDWGKYVPSCLSRHCANRSLMILLWCIEMD